MDLNASNMQMTQSSPQHYYQDGPVRGRDHELPDEEQWVEIELSKAKAILVGSGKHFEELAAIMETPLVGSTPPQLVNSVNSLGVLLGFSLMLSSHVAASTNNVFYHFW